jgi:hypothetical protein
MVLFPIPDHSNVKPPLLYDLGRLLDKHVPTSGHSAIDRDLMAWCTLLGATACGSDTVYRAQYIKRLRVLIGSDPRLREWEFCTALAKRFLWWGYLLDSLAWEALDECGPTTSLPFLAAGTNRSI